MKEEAKPKSGTTIKIEEIEKEAEKIDLDELRRKYDSEANTRDLRGWYAAMVTVLAVALSAFHIYTSGFGLLLAIKQRAIHLAFVLFLVYILYPQEKGSHRN